MSAHNHFTDAYKEFRGTDAESAQYIADPGSNGTFDLRGHDNGYAVIASGTRKLPDNIPKGVTFTIYAGGAVLIQTAAASNVALLASGEYAVCKPTSATTWKCVLSSTAASFALAVDANIATVAGASLSSYTAAVSAAGLYAQALQPAVKFTTSAAASPVAAAAGELTGAQHVYWENTTDGAVSLTPRTATQMYQNIGVVFPTYAYKLTIVNRGDNTVTLQAATGVTYSGETTIATTTTRTYVVAFTSATACTITSVDKGTIET